MLKLRSDADKIAELEKLITRLNDQKYFKRWRILGALFLAAGCMLILQKAFLSAGSMATLGVAAIWFGEQNVRRLQRGEKYELPVQEQPTKWK